MLKKTPREWFRRAIRPAGMMLMFTLVFCRSEQARAQIDPFSRSLLELGYDQPLEGHGPQGVYAYYYYNNPSYFESNVVWRLALGPGYLDSELGFPHLISPTTDLGLGVNGGYQGANYYEIRQGQYLEGESFDGNGGGPYVSIYQLINPGQMIPLSAVIRGGYNFTAYQKTDETSSQFQLPTDQNDLFFRGGLRLAGKEPLLYPDLGLELSVWYERQWRLDHDTYGFAGDRSVEPSTDLYWAYAGLNYAWTNIGHQIEFSVTAGGSDHADRFSAWRLGGVLPLIAEFPLILPGYYYQELTARRFVLLNGAYEIPLTHSHDWQLRFEAASANVDSLPGFEQREAWNTGAGVGLSYTSPHKLWKVVLRYGYAFNAIRDNEQGAQSVGLLCQLNLGWRQSHE
jgi:hypothetical protein